MKGGDGRESRDGKRGQGHGMRRAGMGRSRGKDTGCGEQGWEERARTRDVARKDGKRGQVHGMRRAGMEGEGRDTEWRAARAWRDKGCLRLQRGAILYALWWYLLSFQRNLIVLGWYSLGYETRLFPKNSEVWRRISWCLIGRNKMRNWILIPWLSKPAVFK